MTSKTQPNHCPIFTLSTGSCEVHLWRSRANRSRNGGKNSSTQDSYTYELFEEEVPLPWGVVKVRAAKSDSYNFLVVPPGDLANP